MKPATSGSTSVEVSLGLASAAGRTDPSERVNHLRHKVEEGKRARLTFGEYVCLAATGIWPVIFTLGLGGIVSVPANTKIAIFRYGKLVKTLSRPGLTYVFPSYEAVSVFSGVQTHKSENINVIDAAGNPIIVSSLLEYSVQDPAALRIALDGQLNVLHNAAEQAVRLACAKLPLVGQDGHDIRSQSHEMGAAMVRELQPEASVFGVQIHRLVIVEARYAPEIASAMLAKQQAAAMISAREAIVIGALGIVRDTLAQFPDMSPAGKERVIAGLLTTLTSHSPATPVINV